MKKIESGLQGVFFLQAPVRADERGFFVKPFEASFFAGQGWPFSFAEAYYSVSQNNVLRGLHVQTPPAQGAKLVACQGGRVWDVVLDLRKGSPTYGKSAARFLEAGDAVFMPAGIAHGFWVEQGPATLLYLQEAAYAPALDTGVLWKGAGIDWPCENPLVSQRDCGFASLEAFASPF